MRYPAPIPLPVALATAVVFLREAGREADSIALTEAPPVRRRAVAIGAIAQIAHGEDLYSRDAQGALCVLVAIIDGREVTESASPPPPPPPPG